MAYDVIRDFWLCTDCVFAVEYGDMPEGYEGEDAEQREAAIQAGIESLPGLVSDNYEEEQAECDVCGWHGNRSELIRLFNDDYGWAEDACPNCREFEPTIRSSGRDEFSGAKCDCCGTTLGGERHRYARLIEKEEDQRSLF